MAPLFETEEASRKDPGNILDKNTYHALQSFERSVLPTGIALSGNDGEAIRRRSEIILSGQECQVLLMSSEKLLSAIASFTGCTLIVELLGRLPRLVARQATMLAYNDALPEILERKWLRTQVDELQKQQLVSTTTYLQELGTLRARLRKAAGVHVEGDDGHLAQNQRRLLSEQVPKHSDSANEGRSRRSFRSSFTFDSEPLPGLPEKSPSQPPSKSPSRRASNASASLARRGSTGDMTAGQEFRKLAAGHERSQQEADNEIESGYSFNEVHNYLWDPVEHLPQELQIVVGKVLSEKVKCFLSQKEAATAAELASLCKKLDDSLKGTAIHQVQKLLDEAKEKISAKEEQNASCFEQIQVLKEQTQTQQNGLNSMRELQAKMQDTFDENLQKSRVRVQQLEEENEALTEQVNQFKAEQALQEQQWKESARERSQILTVRADEDEGIVKDVLERMLPELVNHLSKELKDNNPKKVMKAAIDAIKSHGKKLEEQRDNTVAKFEIAQAQMEESIEQQKLLQADLQQEKDERRNEAREMKRKLTETEVKIEQMHVDFEGYVQEAPVYVALAQKHQEMEGELQETRRKAEAFEQELKNKKDVSANIQELLQTELEKRDEELESTRKELQQATESQFHPAKVAETRGELRRVKYELQAALHGNQLLRDSMVLMRERLVGSQAPRTLKSRTADMRAFEEAMGDLKQADFVMELSNRTVYSRLYEDAVRRSSFDFAPDEPSSDANWKLDPGSEGALSPMPSSSMQSSSAAVSRSQTVPSKSLQLNGLAKQAVRKFLGHRASNLQQSLNEPLFEEQFQLVAAKKKRLSGEIVHSPSASLPERRNSWASPSTSPTRPVRRASTCSPISLRSALGSQRNSIGGGELQEAAAYAWSQVRDMSMQNSDLAEMARRISGVDDAQDEVVGRPRTRSPRMQPGSDRDTVRVEEQRTTEQQGHSESSFGADSDEAPELGEGRADLGEGKSCERQLSPTLGHSSELPRSSPQMPKNDKASEATSCKASQLRPSANSPTPPSPRGSSPTFAFPEAESLPPGGHGDDLMATADSPSTSTSPARSLGKIDLSVALGKKLRPPSAAVKRPAPAKTRPNRSRPSTGTARKPEEEPAGRSTPPPSADVRSLASTPPPSRPISRPSTGLVRREAQPGRSTPPASARRPASAATDVPRERPSAPSTPRVAPRPVPRKAAALLPTMRPKSARFAPTASPAFSSSSARPASATAASPHAQRPSEEAATNLSGLRGRTGQRANRADEFFNGRS